MKPIGATNINWQASAANAPWRVRALQKPKPASALNGERHSQARDEPTPLKPQTRFWLRQSGTPDAVSFRHAAHKESPRLTAAFTAQLLGQILPDPERPASPTRFYGHPGIALSLGLDTRL
jgi:hypothetical protein